MIIKKDNGKVKMELTDEELIIKGIFKDTRIKRENIRSAIIEENRFLLLTYDNKIICRSIINITPKYKEQLKLLVDEINKENIIFSTKIFEDKAYIYTMMYFAFVFVTLFIYKIQNETLETMVFLAVSTFYGGSGVWMYNKENRLLGTVYKIDKKEFEVIGLLGGVKERFTLDDVEFIKKTLKGNMYKNKKTGYKFYLENDNNPIKYPVIHSTEIKRIENVVIDK